MDKYNVLNSRARRVDGPAKATGKAIYTDDITLPGMLHGAVLHSTQAHARIKGIDTSAAEALPGVKAVLTGRDIPDTKYGVSPARYDETVLAMDKVRYVGEEVAAVAAVDLETALKAVSLIKVDYEPLPHVLTVEEALAPEAPLIHEEFPGNLCAEVHQEFGDFDSAIKECDIVLTRSMSNKRQDGAFIEPFAALADYDQRGYLTLTSSTQSVHYTQRTVAMVTGLPIGKVRVVKPYVGGGFGPKASASAIDLISSLLSIKTRRPVKITHSREEVFLYSRARHQFQSQFTIGAMNDGTIVCLHNKTYLEGGAYSSFGIATVYYAGSLLGGPYKLKHMKYDGYRVFTNKPACGAQRGHGGVISRALFEQMLDMIAERIGMDPVELRLKNMMQTGDVTVNELAMSSLGMRECLEAVRDGSDWNNKKGKLPPGKGIGLACGFFRLRGRIPHLPLRHLPRHGGGQAGRGRRHGRGGDRLGRDRPGLGHHLCHDRGRGPGGGPGGHPDHLRRHRLLGGPGGLLLAPDPDDRTRHQGRGRGRQAPGSGGPLRTTGRAL